MNELKARGVDDVYIEYYNTGEHELAQVYLKSEADKVIADLIEKNKRLAHKDAIMASETIKDLFKELRHHKYKRCLAMAQEWRSYATFCGMQSSCHNHRGFGKTAEKWTWKEIHAWKCKKRWLELAEKDKQIEELKKKLGSVDQ